ncbi:radical SAM/SPASM domain-containing protein [Streptomyces roseifaciens]|uniref:radical SAM/SPASM domain-containing protein n=1 Tax=Streptomyces roseifaciens TaxID=1488406 RepID=UPI000AD76C9D|nr:radical SAM protein [Streptomyces roseifaciens]
MTSSRAGSAAHDQARDLIEMSAPVNPDLHLLRTEVGTHALVVNGSRLFDLDAETYEVLDRARQTKDEAGLSRAMSDLGMDAPQLIDDRPLVEPPVRALSLAVAQKCNLGCTYCYAQQGSFGSAPTSMPVETALEAVELLFSTAAPGERVNLSFLGGEPLLNRPVIHAATEQAVRLSDEKNVPVTFSITTNGTVVTAADADFFESHGFAVTVSLDGTQEVHDSLRPYRGGRGSFHKVISNVTPLLATQRRMQVSARVTVTPDNLGLKDTLDAFVELGFHSVGFSPLLNSPNGRRELTVADLEVMLGQMVACGEEFERQVIAGRRYPFANLVNALRELHQGTHRPYPCGAGAGYLGVSAEGDLAACHRFVGDAKGAMGNLSRGVDRSRQLKWLDDRHVHRQEPCRSCWARYLCGGGCHHEVIERGRPSCHYIRGWLHYALGAYHRLQIRRPDYFRPVPATRAPA